MLNEKVFTRGDVLITINRADGKVEEYEHENLVVTTGRNHVADQLSNQAQATMSHMAIGEGTTTPVVGDTSLETEISRLVFASKEPGAGADANKVIYNCDWAAGVGTGAITEAGMFNSAAAGVMLSRAVFPVKNKGAGDSLSIQWTLTVSG